MITDSKLPLPSRGQVRVRAEASSVQFTDTIIRRGLYPDAGRPPLTVGYDVVGRIDALGSDVQGWSIGDRVADLTTVGANATHVVRPAQGLVPVPESIEAPLATALILSGLTAYQMMFRHVQVRSGQRVLIQGGNRGVGRFAIALAVRAGVRVWATARASHHEELRSLRAEPVDYTRADYPELVREQSGGGVDFVFDGQGVDAFRPAQRALHRRGHLVTIGASDAVRQGRSMAPPVVAALARNLNPWGPRISLYSITRYRRRHPSAFREDLTVLYTQVQRGDLPVQIERCIGFSQIAGAHEELERGGTTGKIVLIPEAAAA
jgi:NADPH:quinone reductase